MPSGSLADRPDGGSIGNQHVHGCAPSLTLDQTFQKPKQVETLPCAIAQRSVSLDNTPFRRGHSDELTELCASTLFRLLNGNKGCRAYLRDIKMIGSYCFERRLPYPPNTFLTLAIPRGRHACSQERSLRENSRRLAVMPSANHHFAPKPPPRTMLVH